MVEGISLLFSQPVQRKDLLWMSGIA